MLACSTLTAMKEKSWLTEWWVGRAGFSCRIAEVRPWRLYHGGSRRLGGAFQPTTTWPGTLPTALFSLPSVLITS